MKRSGGVLTIIGGLAVVLALALPAKAAFHIAVIDEVMTSYAGDSTAQFVEIRMLAGGQNITNGSELGAFDSSGAYIGKILDITTNVSHGTSGGRWIMGSTSFAAASLLTPDFVFSGPTYMSTAGGMVCWGKPTTASNPAQYVDCLAYGNYSGPTNSHIGTPTTLDGIGHSMVRSGNSNNNAADFACGDPASPTNNAGTSILLNATSPCPVPPTATPSPTATNTPTPAITCPATPLVCKTPAPGKGSYQIKGRSDPGKRKMNWKWNKGEATLDAELGDPLGTTHYGFCVYDGAGSNIMQAAVSAGGTCGTKPCWKQAGKPGALSFKYKNADANDYGIAAITIKGGLAGKTQVAVKGKGEGLILPALPPTLPPSGLRVQVINSLGTCWGATYSDPALSDPAATESFKDKND